VFESILDGQLTQGKAYFKKEIGRSTKKSGKKYLAIKKPWFA
jgi:hypothetical protein